METCVLAADLGGTNLRMAAVSDDGTILELIKAETPDSRLFPEISGAIIDAARQCIGKLGNERHPRSLGLAIPLLISPNGEDLYHSPNLSDLEGKDLAGSVGNALGLDVFIENDANAAAAGEHWLGASRGSGSSICITLGTGVGGGIILDGKVWRGAHGTAGEIGHLCVEPSGAACGCGSRGCLEQYASATAITRMTRELLPDHPGTALKAGDLSAETVFEAGINGDELGIEVFRRAGRYLGIALAGLINCFDPEAIVIGGGVSAGWDLFIEEALGTVKEKAFQVPAERVRILRAELGDLAGILGAAKYTFERS